MTFTPPICLLATLHLFLLAPGFADTFYVDSAASDDSGSGSADAPKKHIQSGIDLLSTSGGDSLIIRPGTYSDPLDAIIDPPSGTPGSYNVIRAEVDGTVLITGIRDHPELSFHTDNNLYLDGYEGLGAEPAYLQFEGLHFRSRTGVKTVGGDHIKFLRTSFEQGPDGNEYVLSIGGSYLLFEDCLFYGVGGRQAFGLFEGDHVVVRRAVMRHDNGWRPIGGDLEPQGIATVYNSTFVEIQNVLLLDSFSDPASGGAQWWYGSLTFSSNGAAATQNTNVRGLISLNVEGPFSIAGGWGDVNGLQIDDIAVGWTDPSIFDEAGVFFIMDDGAVKSASIERATVHGAWGMAYLNYNASGSFLLNLTNSIAHSIQSGVFFNGEQTLNESYNNCFDFPVVQGYSSCEGPGSITLDPTQNGLLYLPRIEPGSFLETAGSGGSQVGANIVHRTGVSGTLYGEPGYNVDTGASLWPWPYEERIKAEMCTDVGVSRGFCSPGSALAGGPVTLTSYIWEALGNPCPESICSNAQQVFADGFESGETDAWSASSP